VIDYEAGTAILEGDSAGQGAPPRVGEITE
jgi:hypothetical protein